MTGTEKIIYFITFVCRFIFTGEEYTSPKAFWVNDGDKSILHLHPPRLLRYGGNAINLLFLYCCVFISINKNIANQSD
tara:strand:- start:627 stop:860 length:234 start_codon:yes stop_codon:yes gene_type:complete